MTNTELITYLDAIIGTTEGHLCAAVGLKPYRDDNGKYKHETWKECTFAWPQDRDRAIEFTTKAADLGDVYLCPYLMREPKRRKGLAASRVLIHADIDQDLDEQAVKDLGGFIIRSGTAGHGHVYVLLAWPVTPEQHEALCRGLADKLGGDHKYSDNDLLRPPGTLNYKPATDGGDPADVEAVWCAEGPVEPRELADKLGVDLANPVTHTGAPRQPKVDTTGCPVNLDQYPAIREALDENSGDRSADTYRVAKQCRSAGLTLEEARWVVRSREDLRTRLDDRPDDDMAAVWLKLDAAERQAERIVAPTAPVTDGAELLDEILGTLTRYVIFPTEAAAIATTLWVAATHALPAWQHATRLVIRSPQKRCGKSRLLDMVAFLSFNSMLSSDVSTAVIYRTVGDDDTKTPTLLIDEADALFGTKAKAEQNEDLRGLLNSGFQRGRVTRRCVGPNQTPTEFHTFAMCALASIKSLPDTIEDRAAIIDLKRRKPGETVARFRMRRDTKPLKALRDKLTAWARNAERVARMADSEPEMPAGVEDRAQDAWEPLIAVADEAGQHWPGLARAACEELAGAAEDDANDVQLLVDIHQIFSATAEPFLRSSVLVKELKDCDESPWRDAELTPHKLARHLKHFDVKPRPGPGYTARGYHAADFTDAFSRYIRREVSDRRETGPEQRGKDENQ